MERATEVAQQAVDKPAKVAKTKPGPNFGMNMPLMSSAFDTAMWLNAA